MLGVLIAGVALAGVVVFTFIRREIPLYVLIAIFVLTAEFGVGFTSFQGSIFFNQNFLNLAKLKLVEVILYSYAGLLVLLDLPLHRKLTPSPLRRLYWFWFPWLVVLLYVQYNTRGFIDPVVFRNVYFSWVLLYVFVNVIDSRPAMQRVIIITFALITIKLCWLLLMFVIGRGDHTPRGSSPIFWDDKLLYAFTWALLVLIVFILQTRTEDGSWPTGWIYASMVLLIVIIVLSLRRNYLAQVAVGIAFALISKGKHLQLQRFFSLALIGAVLLGVLFTAGQAIGDRLPLVQQMTEYVQLLNFTSDEFAGTAANQVHLFNVQTYAALLSKYTSIQLFGISAAPSQNFETFNRQYLGSLGLAHNGPLRAIFENGIGGLLVWAGFFCVAFRGFFRCRFEQLDVWERALVIGSTAAIFAHLVISLTVIPPFFTTMKSFFFFLIMVYVVEFYSHASQLPETETTEPVLSCVHVDTY